MKRIEDFMIELYCLAAEERQKEKQLELDLLLNAQKYDIAVIFNNPATILYKNGKKYVSKAHKEEFDEEKGLLMCLAKANGYSHQDIKRMLKKATRQEKK